MFHSELRSNINNELIETKEIKVAIRSLGYEEEGD